MSFGKRSALILPDGVTRSCSSSSLQDMLPSVAPMSPRAHSLRATRQIVRRISVSLMVRGAVAGGLFLYFAWWSFIELLGA